MSTKAEDVRAESQKKGPSKKKTRKLAQRKPKKAHAPPIAAGKKARVAKESSAPGKRPSRKSTRGSANRAKSDSTLEIHAEAKKNAPTARARSAKVKAKRTRGAS
jgi:hypothetical protein